MAGHATHQPVAVLDETGLVNWQIKLT